MPARSIHDIKVYHRIARRRSASSRAPTELGGRLPAAHRFPALSGQKSKTLSASPAPPKTSCRSPSASLRHHHLHEFLVVDLPVTIHISLADHLINLLIGELLAQVGHHVTKLGRADEAVAVTVKDLEGLN